MFALCKYTFCTLWNVNGTIHVILNHFLHPVVQIVLINHTKLRLMIPMFCDFISSKCFLVCLFLHFGKFRHRIGHLGGVNLLNGVCNLNWKGVNNSAMWIKFQEKTELWESNYEKPWENDNNIDYKLTAKIILCLKFNSNELFIIDDIIK